MKLSPAQEKLLTYMGDQPLIRLPGGFWVVPDEPLTKRARKENSGRRNRSPLEPCRPWSAAASWLLPKHIPREISR